jgi:Zn-dependent peptidase ImmA (M78 family)
MKHVPAIRKRAEHLLATYQFAEAVPVPVEKIARRLGLEVVKADLEGDISGLLVRDGNQVRICVNEDDAPNRQRFTIAHEIGHHYLGHTFADGEQVHVDRGHVIRMRSPASSNGEDRMEIEANQFANTLLMPEQTLRSMVTKLGGAPVSDVNVANLARSFAVSEQAMTIRLSVLGLL